MTLTLKALLARPDIQASRREFADMMKAVAHSGRLGIFSLECQHRQTQTHVNASRSLGRGKDFITVSADSLLNSIKQWQLSAARGPTLASNGETQKLLGWSGWFS